MKANEKDKLAAKALKKLAGAMADIAFGSVSVCGMHQPKEPVRICRKWKDTVLLAYSIAR